MSVSVLVQSAVSVFNAQPHIDEVTVTLESQLKLAQARMDVPYGYCLQHKHFSLNEGEIILFKFDVDKIDASVVRVEDATKPMFPVMYYTTRTTSDEVILVPVGYSLNASDAVDIPPQVDLIEGVGVCSTSFAKGWLERTNEELRIQRFAVPHREPIKGIDVTTQIFPTIQNACNSWCETRFGGSHDRHHSYQ